MPETRNGDFGRFVRHSWRVRLRRHTSKVDPSGTYSAESNVQGNHRPGAAGINLAESRTPPLTIFQAFLFPIRFIALPGIQPSAPNTLARNSRTKEHSKNVDRSANRSEPRQCPTLHRSQNGRGQSRLLPQPLQPRPLTYDDGMFFLLPCESAEAYSILRRRLSKASIAPSRNRNDTGRPHGPAPLAAQPRRAFESNCFEEDGSLDEKRLALFCATRPATSAPSTSASTSC